MASSASRLHTKLSCASTLQSTRAREGVAKLFLDFRCIPCYHTFQVILRFLWRAASGLPRFLFVASTLSAINLSRRDNASESPKLAQLWFKVDPLESAVRVSLASVGNKGLITPLESALTRNVLAKPFGIRTYKKQGGGWPSLNKINLWNRMSVGVLHSVVNCAQRSKEIQ